MKEKESATGLVSLIIAACWIIAIANWLGYEHLSTDRYESLTLGIYVCRTVVFVSILGAVAFFFLKR